MVSKKRLEKFLNENKKNEVVISDFMGNENIPDWDVLIVSNLVREIRGEQRRAGYICI